MTAEWPCPHDPFDVIDYGRVEYCTACGSLRKSAPGQRWRNPGNKHFIVTVHSADHKRCTKCEEMKPREEFHIHRKSKDGRRSICKECRKT